MRSTPRRASRLPLGLTTALTLLVLSVSGCNAPGPLDAHAAPPDPRLAAATRSETNGWIYVHLQGSPADLGYQHGYLLAPEIQDLVRVTRPLLLQLTKKDWSFYRKAAESVLWPKIETEYQQELDGIVAGLAARATGKDTPTLDRWDIVALNGMLELAYYYGPWVDKQQSRKPVVKSPEMCSAFVATGAYTRDHRIVMGHNAW